MERVYLEEVDSTNKWAKEHISELPHLTVVYADRQTAGRGRFSRKWNDNGNGNIYASIVIKPNGGMKDIYSNLTQYLCLMLAEVFEEYNLPLPAKIKWPNDVRIDGKKISGILAEGLEVNGGYAIVLGFGVNLNCSREDMDKIDQPATSLNLVTGMEIDKEYFLNRVLDKFCLGYDKFIEGGFASVRSEYLERAEFLNKQISVKVFDKTITGFAKDVAENGALKIVDKDNKEQILYIGDIL